MKVTLGPFNFGLLGQCKIQTDTEHGNPDVVSIDGVDISSNGPTVDFIMLQLGERFTKALIRAESEYSQKLVGKIG